MANRDIVAIGTSAGGLEALRFLAKGFKHDFPASILVTIHLPLEFRSYLDELLTQAAPLPNGPVDKSGPTNSVAEACDPPRRARSGTLQRKQVPSFSSFDHLVARVVSETSGADRPVPLDEHVGDFKVRLLAQGQLVTGIHPTRRLSPMSCHPRPWSAAGENDPQRHRRFGSTLWRRALSFSALSPVRLLVGD